MKFENTWKANNVLYLENLSMMFTDEIRRIFSKEVLGAKVGELYRWALTAGRWQQP